MDGDTAVPGGQSRDPIFDEVADAARPLDYTVAKGLAVPDAPTHATVDASSRGIRSRRRESGRKSWASTRESSSC